MEVEQAVGVVVGDQDVIHDVSQGPGDHGRATSADDDDKDDTNSDTDSMSLEQRLDLQGSRQRTGYQNDFV